MQQEKWIKAWVEKRTGFDCQFQIKFYAARYDGEGFFSIFPVGKFVMLLVSGCLKRFVNLALLDNRPSSALTMRLSLIWINNPLTGDITEGIRDEEVR